MSTLDAWHRTNRGIDEIRKRLFAAATPEQFQAVGLLCREVTISLAQAIFNATQHDAGGSLSSTDAKGMLEAYIAAELTGSSNDELRAYAKAAVKLADALLHRRTATVRDAAICAEATTSLVSLLGPLAGRDESVDSMLQRRGGRAAIEREYMCVLLAHAVHAHPFIQSGDFTFAGFEFGDTQLSLKVARGGVTAVGAASQIEWWRPSTRDAANQLVDRMLLDALGQLPPIEHLTLGV